MSETTTLQPPPAAETTAPPPQVPVEAPAPARSEKTAPLPFNDAFAALDKIVQPAEDNELAKDDPRQEAANSAEKTAEKNDSAKPAETDGKEPTKPTGAEGKPVKAAELRAAYDQAKKRLADSDKKIADFERELKALRDQPKNDAERAELKTKLEQAEKRRTELEDHMRYLDYRKSTEFQEKYEKPYTEAWAGALKEIAELNVTDAEGNSRPGNSQDLIALCNLPLGQAMAEAKEKFGELASIVLAHRKTIRDLADAQSKAEGEAKTKSKEFFDNREKTQREQAERIQGEWRNLNEDAVKKYPQWFATDESDLEGNKLLEEGFKLADAAFSGQLKPEEAIRLHSAIRNKAAGFDRLAYRLNKAGARIKELEKELSGFKESEPTKGEGDGKPKKVPVSWEDDLVSRAK